MATLGTVSLRPLLRRWRLVMIALIALATFIISPLLTLLLGALLITAHVLLRRRGGRGGVVVLRRYVDVDMVSYGRLCLGYGIGNVLARLGNKWLICLRLGSLEQGIVGELSRLGIVQLSVGGHYLVIVGRTIDDALATLEEAVGLLRSRNIAFAQLRPMEAVEVVVGPWLR